ncbi:uncharacterized protein PADG_11603 [Paracoccidioides brasiliensis Pb18]|uniref:Fatty acid desaturase domain-containing protein n=1 Tax=Paracoccidioides brasiliensis (strain Pb18) TaxID=502780 RepID=A0A0A0HWF8_PARBD|nr:uncharacterized protein PADG_11603 [Paracoccidioides brasiliensis Pb18]KGM92401.1 hypothetical protein PADG_11603 [Paracoccidioides brasiliensis Pb18]
MDIDPNLTRADLIVIQNLFHDVPKLRNQGVKVPKSLSSCSRRTRDAQCDCVGSQQKLNNDAARSDHLYHAEKSSVETLASFNNPQHEDFEPTVFVMWDLKDVKLPRLLNDYLLQPYIRFGRSMVRVETDVVMLTHLLLYFATSVPSAIFLYYHFSWIHGVFHWAMQSYYVGTYTLMMHQHIHMGGILSPRYSWIDMLFPYITNPLMGHTWNSYYYHHVKHHHVESNGPNDLSSTIRYQRDDLGDFLCYVCRFMFFVWLELPLYFFRKSKTRLAMKAAFWELGSYLAIFLLFALNWKTTTFVFALPLLQLRVGLMVGNWGQHAFVDEIDPDSDFRSSITLIDVASNRFCYNDGYHTSHHLNPLRHWREHPVAFLRQKERYSKEHALVFHNIDYVMITVKLLQKDYAHLAKCLIPIGEQVHMSLDEIAAMLRTKTRRFSEADIKQKFRVNH